jgi:hypothetical protein
MSSKIGVCLIIAIFLSACGSNGGNTGSSESDGGGDTVFETGPNVSIGPVSVSVTINTEGDVILSGSVTPTLIGIENLGGIGWEFGFEKTLYDAQSASDLLFILYQNGDGEIVQHQYDVRQPFDIQFSSTDWVRRMKREENGSIVVFVERRVSLQASRETNQQSGTQPSASGFIRDYYATISVGDYQSAWNGLTDDFKAKYNSGGYGPYADWWSTVDRVDVMSVNVTNQDSYRANLYVELSYYYTSGKVDTYDLMSFTLVYSNTSNSWMIDDAILISGTR